MGVGGEIKLEILLYTDLKWIDFFLKGRTQKDMKLREGVYRNF